MRTAAGLALLLFQVVMIVYARFVPSRYFCWAPFDIQTEYKLRVTVNGRPLKSSEFAPAIAGRRTEPTTGRLNM
jgi:hypothetical protein